MRVFMEVPRIRQSYAYMQWVVVVVNQLFGSLTSIFGQSSSAGVDQGADLHDPPVVVVAADRVPALAPAQALPAPLLDEPLLLPAQGRRRLPPKAGALLGRGRLLLLLQGLDALGVGGLRRGGGGATLGLLEAAEKHLQTTCISHLKRQG